MNAFNLNGPSTGQGVLIKRMSVFGSYGIYRYTTYPWDDAHPEITIGLEPKMIGYVWPTSRKVAL